MRFISFLGSTKYIIYEWVGVVQGDKMYMPYGRFCHDKESASKKLYFHLYGDSTIQFPPLLMCVGNGK